MTDGSSPWPQDYSWSFANAERYNPSLVRPLCYRELIAMDSVVKPENDSDLAHPPSGFIWGRWSST